jgi:hypothetical protein
MEGCRGDVWGWGMRVLCFFMQCRWLRVVNVTGPAIVTAPSDPLGLLDCSYGLYQCSRCKTISVGAVRGPGWRHE